MLVMNSLRQVTLASSFYRPAIMRHRPLRRERGEEPFLRTGADIVHHRGARCGDRPNDADVRQSGIEQPGYKIAGEEGRLKPVAGRGSRREPDPRAGALE